MIQKNRITDFLLLINIGHGFFLQIRSGQQRNSLQILFPARLLLIQTKFFCLLYDLRYLFAAHSRFLLRQFLRQLSFFSAGQPFHRIYDYDTLMGILQQVLPDHIFIIGSVYLLLQLPIDLQQLYLRKRFPIIIQPRFQHLQSIHKSLRIRTKIRFSVLKFTAVQACFHRLLIKPLLGSCLKRILYSTDKSIPLFGIRILCDHGKIRLPDTRIIYTAHIRPDAGIQQSLLNGRSRYRTQYICQCRKSVTELRSRLFSQRNVISQIRIILLRLALHNRILFLNHSHGRKGRL